LQEIEGRALRDGQTAGCRTCKAERQKKRAYVAYWQSIKVRARDKELPLTVTWDWLLELLERQDFSCALTGLPIEIAVSRSGHSHGGSTASLDRIDSSRGYEPDNFQWVHKDVNKIKWELSQERFIEICRLVVEKHAH
jgi:hypothetical protein